MTTKKRTKQSFYKSVQRKTTVGAAVGDALSEIQSLRDEMRDWADNMESGNLGHTDRAQRVTEAADALDGFCDDEPDVPECVSQLECSYDEQVPRRSGKSTGRSTRLSNAVAMLNGAIAVCQEFREDADDADAIEEVQTLEDALESAVGEAEGVELPGMYG